MVMCRLAGVFISSFQQHRVHSNPLDHWLEWVQFEERKRLGWMAFLMDTESAALFRHYLIVHCFTVKIDWPCDDAVWAAEEPFAWSALLKKDVSPPPFRHALRQIAGRGKIAPSMSETHLWILVHGMISVSWTLLWRDLGDLSMVHEGKVTYWKDSLRRAFYAFRDHAERVFARRVAEGDNPTDVHVYWTGVPLAHLGGSQASLSATNLPGCILLLSDTELIRIYCGASNIAGRPISPGEWHNASACVNAWARSPDGAYAVAAAVERESPGLHTYCTNTNDSSTLLRLPVVSRGPLRHSANRDPMVYLRRLARNLCVQLRHGWAAGPDGAVHHASERRRG